MYRAVRTHELALIFILAIALACASTPPDRVAFNTLKSLRATAETAVAVFKEGRAQTPPLFTEEQELQARILYSKYLAADKVAAEALLAYKQSDDLTVMVATVSKAVTDLVFFVDSLKKKGP